MKVLVVIDMQKDFIDGALGTPEAEKIVPLVAEKVQSFDGEIIFTRDTHNADYRNTQEGKRLPVPHCICETPGWEICSTLKPFAKTVIDKPGFGSLALCHQMQGVKNLEQVELVGLCTDICIISNAMLLKAYLPETPLVIDASCCAGVTPESHEIALKAMEMCQIEVIRE